MLTRKCHACGVERPAHAPWVAATGTYRKRLRKTTARRYLCPPCHGELPEAKAAAWTPERGA